MKAALDALLDTQSGLPNTLLRLLTLLSSDKAMNAGFSFHDLYKEMNGRDPHSVEDFVKLRAYLSKLRRQLKIHFGERGELATSDWYCVLLDAHTGGKRVGARNNLYLLEWRRTPPRVRCAAPEELPADQALRSAPFEVVVEEAAQGITPGPSGSEEPDEGFGVAVLPFRSSSAQAESLADGLTEEITTRLARFSYLRVVARGSANKALSRGVDMRAVGSQLGARFLMEGSLQQAGARVRASVQLVDAATGVELWAETYERPFDRESAFELQDDLVPRIVATVANGYGGVLCRAISQAVRNKPVDSLTAYESLMRAFNYYDRMTPAEHAIVRDELEVSVGRHANDANLHAALSSLYLDEYRYGFNPLPDPLGRAYKHAQLAVDYSPSSHLAHQMLASTHFYRRDLGAFRAELRTVLQLNRYDQSSTITMAYFLCCSGDLDAGMALWKSCSDWTESPPGWFWIVPYFDSYRRKDNWAALDALRKVSMPGNPRYQAYLAAVFGQLDDQQRAGEAVARLFELQPSFDAEAEFGQTFEGELLEQFLDGLRKAGLGAFAK